MSSKLGEFQIAALQQANRRIARTITSQFTTFGVGEVVVFSIIVVAESMNECEQAATKAHLG